MADQYLDLGAAKLAVAAWINGLDDADRRFPSSVTKHLLDQLEQALPFLDADGVPCLELPALASLGQGIFRCSFRVQGTLVRIAPYAPPNPQRPPLPGFTIPELIPLAAKAEGGPPPRLNRRLGRT
jgi:hypothetical protein